MAAKSALAALLLCGGIQGLKLRRGVNTRALGRHVPLPTRVTSQGRRMGMRRKGLAPRAESLAGLPDFLPYPSLASAKETVTWIEGRGMPGQVLSRSRCLMEDEYYISPPGSKSVDVRRPASSRCCEGCAQRFTHPKLEKKKRIMLASSYKNSM
eukprot:1208332-Amorphochlora_amoeboformis.AAC.1